MLIKSTSYVCVFSIYEIRKNLFVVPVSRYLYLFGYIFPISIIFFHANFHRDSRKTNWIMYCILFSLLIFSAAPRDAPRCDVAQYRRCHKNPQRYPGTFSSVSSCRSSSARRPRLSVRICCMRWTFPISPHLLCLSGSLCPPWELCSSTTLSR